MKPVVVALVGNPNSGKTTLFNALTGNQQRVGNWAGVTVDKKRGRCRKVKIPLEFVDLPGCIDIPTDIVDVVPSNVDVASKQDILTDVSSAGVSSATTIGVSIDSELPIDEQITYEFLATGDASIILNVVDATQLERHLYLTLRLLELGRPLVVALNMMDAAKKMGIEIDIQGLSKALNCPVVPIIATQKETTQALKTIILEQASRVKQEHAIHAVSDQGQDTVSIRQADNVAMQQADNVAIQQANAMSDIILAKNRYHKIQEILKEVVKPVVRPMKIKNGPSGESMRESINESKSISELRSTSESLCKSINFCAEPSKNSAVHMTEKLDAILLHRYLGIPFFLLLMYIVFVLTIQIGGGVQDLFDEVLETVCIGRVAEILRAADAPLWLSHLMAHGVGQGLMTTLSFIPVIASMFFCLSILEASGYMARAAFVMDKVMQWVGLSGKSFVPMILGFGCNVPAVLGARTLENHRERILTILMSPFMSCGARLAIFALFVSVFFKEQGHNIIFALYLIGICVALLTGLALRSSVMSLEKTALVMELPPYRWPSMKRIWQTTWYRLKRFLLKAGVIIVPLCASFSLLSVFKTAGEEPWLSYIGRTATPIFAPMGIERDNWPATVGLLTGVLAKEVVVGTLTALYANDALDPSGSRDLSGSGESNESATLKVMALRFGSSVNAFAYLLFVLLYFPCVSVLATIARELSTRWALFSGVWTTGIAYIVAVMFYQGATFLDHPESSLLWISGMSLTLIFGFWGMRKWVGFNMLKQSKRFKNKKSIPTQILVLN